MVLKQFDPCLVVFAIFVTSFFFVRLGFSTARRGSTLYRIPQRMTSSGRFYLPAAAAHTAMTIFSDQQRDRTRFRYEGELQRGSLQREVVVYRVVRNFRSLS